MWFWISIVVGLINAVRNLMARVVLREEEDSLAYSFVQQALVAGLAFPFLFFNWQIPEIVLPFLLLVLVGLWDTLCTYLITESYRFLEVSLRTVIYQSRIIWVVLLGFVFLHESLDWQKLMGAVFIFTGIALASLRKGGLNRAKQLVSRLKEGNKSAREKGVFLTLSTAFLTALELIVLRHLLNLFSPAVLLFGVTMTSVLVLALITPGLKRRVFRLPRLSFLNGVFVGICALLFYLASSMTEISRTLPVVQAFTVLTVILGIVLLKERERVWQKILGGILAAIGVILVKGG